MKSAITILYISVVITRLVEILEGPSGMDELSLSILRAKMVESTLEVVRQIGIRQSIAKRIGYEKKKNGVPIQNLEVEQYLRDLVSEMSDQYGVDRMFSLRFLNQLIQQSVNLQMDISAQQTDVSVYDIHHKAVGLENTGSKIIHLEVGEPDFGPPPKVKLAVIKALADDRTRYTESSGIDILRKGIANKLKEKHTRDLSCKQVLVTPGGRYAIFLAIMSTLLPGDEVIILSPSYPAYSNCVKLLGGKPVYVPSSYEKEWSPTIESISRSINNTTSMIILNSPANPTGHVIKPSVLRDISSLAIENNLLIISDEVYSNFSYTPFSSILDLEECDSVCVSSFSKTFGMTGFRIGYAISTESTIERMNQLQRISLTSIPEFIQFAALEALKCDENARSYSRIMERRLDFICEQLMDLPIEYHRPDGGFYVFARILNKNIDGLQLSNQLLYDKGICVTPGVCFGDLYKDYIRISACQPKSKLALAIDSFREVLS